MKLIDLLIQELPRHGGWPDGVTSVNQAYDSALEKIGTDGDSYELGIKLSILTDNHRSWARSVSECGADVVTREQYERCL